MLDYSTERILKGAKLRTMAPANQFKLNDDEYLTLINDELQTNLVPMILSVREDFFLQDVTYNLTYDSGAGFGLTYFGLSPFGDPISITTSDLLQRAIGTVIKDIWIVDNNLKFQWGVVPISFQDIKGNPNVVGYYFKGTEIVFHRPENFNNKIARIHWFRKPNELVFSDLCTTVLYQNTTDSTITLNSLPAGWGIGTKIDLLTKTQAFDSIVDSVTITDLPGGNVIEVSQVPESLDEGDYVVPEGYACVAQIPLNAVPVLEQLGAIKILESMRDEKGLANALVQLERLKSNFLSVISNRSKSNVKSLGGYGLWK